MLKSEAVETKQLEVHEHHIIRGPRANRTGGWPAGMGSKFSHSHEGGSAPHSHPDTGPAAYTIDKDEWARATGLRGGGRKRFTARPSGEQFPLVQQEPQSFDVFIVGDPPAPREVNGTLVQEIGPGIALPTRIASTFRMTARVHDLRRQP